MLKVELDKEHGIAKFEPKGPLTEYDFYTAEGIIDPYIAQAGPLKGLIVYAEKFPGWSSFAAMRSHLKFIKRHHKKVEHIALVTGSPMAGIVEKIAAPFLGAEVKSFSIDELDDAQRWLDHIH